MYECNFLLHESLISLLSFRVAQVGLLDERVVDRLGRRQGRQPGQPLIEGDHSLIDYFDGSADSEPVPECVLGQGVVPEGQQKQVGG
jgi:hypothetical protein